MPFYSHHDYKGINYSVKVTVITVKSHLNDGMFINDYIFYSIHVLLRRRNEIHTDCIYISIHISLNKVCRYGAILVIHPSII